MKKEPLLAVVAVLVVVAAVMVMFRYEYETSSVSVEGLSVSYDVRRDRWTGTTCIIYPEGPLGQVAKALIGQACE